MATLRLIPEDGGKPHEVAEAGMVGRDASCELVVSHGSVSRRHARLEPRAGGWAVVDQASANGTFIDGQRVADVGLRHGHVLRFGAVSFRVELEGAGHDGQATLTEAAAFPQHLVPESARHIGRGAPQGAAPTPRASSPPPPPPLQVSAATPAPAPPALGGPAAASTGKSRGALFWVGGGCLGCLTILILAGLTTFGALYYFTQPPVEAVRTQLGTLQAGQIDPVYEALDDSYREKVSRDEFVDFVARHPALREYQSASFWNWSLDTRKVTLSGTLTATSGEEEEASFRLVRRGDVWRITTIEVGGDEAP